MPHAVMCPQCNAPLSPHRFARSIVCSFCGATIQLDEDAVYAANFRDSFHSWNSPAAYGLASWISRDDHHWTVEEPLGSGSISDVYAGRRARFPTELAVIKLLRRREDQPAFDNEWDVLKQLHESHVSGADEFVRLLPQPILHGDLTGGAYTGRRVSIFRRTVGFRQTLADVIHLYPNGIPPRASIWVWRRILEILSFIHASGYVHAALLPPHLLIQRDDHGLRLVGFNRAGAIGAAINWKVDSVPAQSIPFYPMALGKKLAPGLDLVMSARCLVAALGGDPAEGSLPKEVPAPLADLIIRLAQSKPDDISLPDAWSLREQLGTLSDQVFGPPAFIPLVTSS